jgi:hypothetical protein
LIKNKLISFLKFAIVWCSFNALIGGFNHFNERPKGVHQGAQCDRASIALNYYHNGLNLLYPEVHENRCKDGIVSCEFPLSNYLTAVIYKGLKYDEKYFRILTFLFVSIGMYALFLLLKLYIKTLPAYLLLFILNASPILLFYASNFIPDASALGLSLAAWYLFFRLYIPHPYLPNVKKLGYVLFFILSITLAIASKTTCFIHWMTMMGVYILSHFKSLKIELTNKKLLLSSLLFAMIMPIVWQLWARHLGKTHNSEFFILHIPLITDKTVYQNAWNVYLGNWPQETFTGSLQYVIGVLLFLPFFIKKHISNALWYITVLNTLGCFVFMAIMINQFMYHDYYILCLLPAVALNWLAIASAVTRIKSNLWWVKIGILGLLIIALRSQFNYGENNLESRYTAGSYWEQSQQKTIDYTLFKNKINGLGITRKNCVLVGYDGAPNNILYLLDLNGRRINKDFNTNQINEAVNEIRPQYLISNDSLFTQKMQPFFKEFKLVSQEKYLTLYKVSN